MRTINNWAILKRGDDDSRDIVGFVENERVCLKILLIDYDTQRIFTTIDFSVITPYRLGKMRESYRNFQSEVESVDKIAHKIRTAIRELRNQVEYDKIS